MLKILGHLILYAIFGPIWLVILFIKADAGLTKGDAIRILINTGILLGLDLFVYAKWMKAEEDKNNYKFKIEMDKINSEMEEQLKMKNNSNSEEIAEESNF